MTDDKIKQHINNIFINISYVLQDYLKNQSDNNRKIMMRDIPFIVENAIYKTQYEETTLESKKSLYSKEHEELCSKYSLLQDKNQKLNEEKL